MRYKIIFLIFLLLLNGVFADVSPAFNDPSLPQVNIEYPTENLGSNVTNNYYSNTTNMSYQVDNFNVTNNLQTKYLYFTDDVGDKIYLNSTIGAGFIGFDTGNDRIGYWVPEELYHRFLVGQRDILAINKNGLIIGSGRAGWNYSISVLGNPNNAEIKFIPISDTWNFSESLEVNGNLTVDLLKSKKNGILFQDTNSHWGFGYDLTGNGYFDTGIYFNTVNGNAQYEYLSNSIINMSVITGNINTPGTVQGNTLTSSGGTVNVGSRQLKDDGTNLDSLSDIDFNHINGLVDVQDVWMQASTNDKISLYDNRLGSVDMYGLGVESSTLYFKSSSIYRWYINENADGGSSDNMELNNTGLGIENNLYLKNNATIEGIMTLKYSIIPTWNVNINGTIAHNITGLYYANNTGWKLLIGD